MRAFILGILLIFTFQRCEGYLFECLDKCECDTDDEVIHCHNNLHRTRLQLPENRLRGFTVLGMTRNNISVLPSQELLLEKFPDLKAIDLELNPNFDCSTLDQYTRITILSNCGKDVQEVAELMNQTTIVDEIGQPTENCDLKCQTRRHYDSAHAYLVRLWQLIKVKFHELSKDSRFFKDIQEFFHEIAKRVSRLAASLRGTEGEFGLTEESEDQLPKVTVPDRVLTITPAIEIEIGGEESEDGDGHTRIIHLRREDGRKFNDEQ